MLAKPAHHRQRDFGIKLSVKRNGGMDMGRKRILCIKIEANGTSVHMKGINGEVDMIPFKGYVKSEIFNGIVEPCGVDTQLVNCLLYTSRCV